MLYFKALFDGLDDMPAADPAVRAPARSPAARARLARAARRAGAVDPATAARLAPNDSAAHPARAGGVAGVGAAAVEPFITRQKKS
jgi:tRNA dimethylallyltransferase